MSQRTQPLSIASPTAAEDTSVEPGGLPLPQSEFSVIVYVSIQADSGNNAVAAFSREQDRGPYYSGGVAWSPLKGQKPLVLQFRPGTSALPYSDYQILGISFGPDYVQPLGWDISVVAVELLTHFWVYTNKGPVDPKIVITPQ